MKSTLRELFLETLERLALERVLPERVACRDGELVIGAERIALRDHERVLAIAIGKAAFRMAASVKALLAPHELTGIAVGPALPGAGIPGFTCLRGGHPYPSADSASAAEAILARLSELGPRDLVLFLISGGGSAIVEKPLVPSISLEDCRELHRVLVTCGAGIVDMNVLRKHASAVKGGRLALAAQGARQVTLFVSDVPSDAPSAVASGPTMPDPSTLADCRALLARLALEERVPDSVRRLFASPAAPETPKPGAPCFARASWHCLLSNADAIDVLADAARARGFVVDVDLSVDDWPLERAAEHLLARLARLRREHPGRAVALLSGGELSSPVRGAGVGGRNQAFVLCCARRIAGSGVAVLSAGTDGIDGNSPAAGALADGETLRAAARLGLDADDCQRRSDAHTYFARLGDVLLTGPTGNNVRDLRVLAAR